MLDRSDSSSQYHYYQPGIGTYVTSVSLSDNGLIQKLKSAYVKAKAAAIGSTFADHVMAGYKFLMRYYCPGDQIYFFGFSRGAYVARFLAEMLDRIGLLKTGNEELISFAWKTFAKWQQRTSRTKAEKARKKQLEQHLADFKDTFCQPVSQIRFLGLFDTVNSVPRFENAWMRRSRFPYTARTSARVIRHAVSIDEHRAKFRQDLVSEVKPSKESRHSRLRRRVKAHFAANPHLRHHRHILPESPMKQEPEQEKPKMSDDNCDSKHARNGPVRHAALDADPDRLNRERHLALAGFPDPPHATDGVDSMISTERSGTASDHGGDIPTEQDIEEVWFPGCHADIGGGWEIKQNECSLSYVPLLWMVHNAQLAGLRFDTSKLAHFDCMTVGQAAQSRREKRSEDFESRASPSGQATSIGKRASASGIPEALLEKASADGKIHDCLRFGSGPSWLSVLSWKMMEYLPFRRMDLQEDGSWKPVRWPLPRGEVRDMPDDAKIHVAAIRRLHANCDYRPGNLIMGGGGRGKLKAPKEEGIGEWTVAAHEGCPLQETYVRKPKSFSRDY
ncbi:hypothetical protein ASPCAL03312 [Aspergillus calidoustus]|uniref:T6SS Phospholipase effector Tle1-like catalytic domain-containing protein n=1 Tax=Aspergillus calidoustus TaxID=454130 RepID=A0A0U5C3F9_ASPCI|nr:hypothetical protein ASPCAL03312 [Aspergillus calidoustus]